VGGWGKGQSRKFGMPKWQSSLPLKLFGETQGDQTGKKRSEKKYQVREGERIPGEVKAISKGIGAKWGRRKMKQVGGGESKSWQPKS